MAFEGKIGPRERAMLLGLGAVVLLALVYFLFLSGGGDTQAPGTAFTPGAGRPTQTTSPAPTLPPETTEVFEGKDPFKPLVQTGTDQGNGAGTPSPGATGGPSDGTRVTLLDIFVQDGTRFASVQVDGETHNVKEGDTFSGNYRVVSITDECATFVLGDERFTLCIGQEVFK